MQTTEPPPLITEPEPLIEIRGSSLTTFQSCARMFVAKMAQDPRSKLGPRLIELGFDDLPERKKADHIGPAIGKALHEAFNLMWQSEIDGYQADPEMLAIAAFNKLDSTTGIEYDEKVGTKDAEYAKAQIKAMVQAYLPIAKTIKPKKMEFRLQARIDPLKPYIVSGHPDVWTPDFRDMKFGKNLSAYDSQLGIYRLMAKSVGMDVAGLFVDWTPRKSLKSKTPVKTTVIEYKPHVAENHAQAILDQAVTVLDKFLETGDEWKIPANPDNMLCSKKWCPAWNTKLCALGRPENNDGGLAE